MADNAKWYVIHTYSGYENAVKAAIEKSVVNRGMSDMVLKMEIPMETVTEVTESGVMKEVERKVFPVSYTHLTLPTINRWSAGWGGGA